MTGIRHARTILGLVTLAAIVGVLLLDPIPQDPAYHDFVDARTIAGVRNFWNVLSNLPFVLVGLYGLTRLSRLAECGTRNGYVALCGAVVLVGVGSGTYHLDPSNATLLWDRLPMTVAFMALLSLVLDERQVLGAGRHMLWPLLCLGVASVAYWYWTESHGEGDLRPYVLVQFLPVLLLPLILVLFRSRFLRDRFVLFALVLYAAAKALEYHDGRIFAALGVLSGHSLKHAVAALAVACLVFAVPTRPRDTR
jgi:hypothetical protein